MALDFPGSGGVGITYTATATQDGLTSFTISLWYQRTAGCGEFGYGRPFTKDPYWQILNDNGDAGNGMVFEADFSTTNGIWSVAYPSNGVWVHDLITYNGTATTNDPVWYRNGSSITVTERTTPSGSIATDTSELYVGWSSDGTEWDGAVAECAYWNRIVTAAEIEALTEGYSASFINNGLKFYAPVIRNNNDIVGGAAATTSGSPTNFAHPKIIYPSKKWLIDNTAAAGGGDVFPEWPQFQSRGFWTPKYS